MPLGKLRPFFDIAGDNFLDKYKENDPGFFIGNRRERLERIGEKDDLSVIRMMEVLYSSTSRRSWAPFSFATLL